MSCQPDEHQQREGSTRCGPNGDWLLLAVLDGCLYLRNYTVFLRETKSKHQRIRASMKRLAIRISVLLFAFAIGLGATHFGNRVYLRFGSVGVGALTSRSGGRGGFTVFRSRDGADLSFDHLDFPSREAASESFQGTLSRASRIIEREALYDRSGNSIVGERVVAMFPARDGSEWAVVICLDDTKLYQISSSSLRHALVFDRRYRRF